MKQPDLFKKCPVCDGSGKSQTYYKPPSNSIERMPCSFCAGLGSVPVKEKK
jgi:DnaJ-class molecular chaperone